MRSPTKWVLNGNRDSRVTSITAISNLTLAPRKLTPEPALEYITPGTYVTKGSAPVHCRLSSSFSSSLSSSSLSTSSSSSLSSSSSSLSSSLSLSSSAAVAGGLGRGSKGSLGWRRPSYEDAQRYHHLLKCKLKKCISYIDYLKDVPLKTITKEIKSTAKPLKRNYE